MDKKITTKIERAAEAINAPRDDQPPLVIAYLARFHSTAWSLTQAINPKPSTTKAIAWLLANDRAWGLAQTIKQQALPLSQQQAAALLAVSPETARQILQAYDRGCPKQR